MKAQSDLAGNRESAAETTAPAERRVTNRIADAMKISVPTVDSGSINAIIESAKKAMGSLDIEPPAYLETLTELTSSIPDMNFGEVTSPPALATVR